MTIEEVASELWGMFARSSNRPSWDELDEDEKVLWRLVICGTILVYEDRNIPLAEVASVYMKAERSELCL